MSAPHDLADVLARVRALPIEQQATVASLAQANVTAAAIAEANGHSRFLTAEAIADEFGIAPRALRTARQRNELRGRRVGHAIVFERSAVEAWLAGRAPTSKGARPGSHAANDAPQGVDIERSLAAVGLRASR